jgi:hypothetical protein
MIIPNEDLSVDQTRLLLREETNRYDPFFLGYAMAKNSLSANFALSTPVGVKRIVGNKDSRARVGNDVFGKSVQPKLRFLSTNKKTRVLPEAKYNPSLMSEFSPGTKLGRNTTLSQFLTPGKFKQSMTLEDQRSVVRNLSMQSFMINSFAFNRSFKKHSLVAKEGYYSPLENENVTDIRDLQTKGRVAVYQVFDKNDEIDHAKTFDLAVYWMQTQLFDKIILQYDTVDPNIRKFNYRRALQNGFAELFV